MEHDKTAVRFVVKPQNGVRVFIFVFPLIFQILDPRKRRGPIGIRRNLLFFLFFFFPFRRKVSTTSKKNPLLFQRVHLVQRTRNMRSVPMCIDMYVYVRVCIRIIHIWYDISNECLSRKIAKPQDRVSRRKPFSSSFIFPLLLPFSIFYLPSSFFFLHSFFLYYFSLFSLFFIVLFLPCIYVSVYATRTNL